MVPCRHCGQLHDAYTSCSAAVRVAGRSPTPAGEEQSFVGNVVADRYRVSEVLGVGSTGAVFGVSNVNLARPAAMKVLRPRLAPAEVVSRVFHGEARAAWTVSHPCLCEVFDVGTLPDATPFFVMERLEGETLAARLARSRLSLAAAVDVMMQLLSGISAIHGRDLLLRDLRPQNIFLAERRGCRPLLKILDFGLARLAPLERIQEDWDTPNGTQDDSKGAGASTIPYYLSPERTRGEHQIEPVSDLFVAAIIFYEMVAGERPFTATSFKGVTAQIAQGKPTPLHERRPEISAELSAFVARALSANPRQRPASAREMQDELRALFEGGRKEPTARTSSAGAPPMAERTADEIPAGTKLPEKRVDATARDGQDHGERPPSRSFARDVARPYEDPYADETWTQREVVGETKSAAPFPRLNSEETDEPTAARSFLVDVVDEASADNADRTVPPPALNAEEGIDVDVSFDDEASALSDGDDHSEDTLKQRAGRPKAGDDEATAPMMELTPELRERIDQLMASGPPPAPAKLQQPARPSRGLKPPRRR